MAPGLYLVATPIGNLGDISERARLALRSADIVACEDTRVTGKLLNLLGLSAKLMPYHEHNAEAAGAVLIERLRHNGVVALVSDAGTPLVSDPGERLVAACIEAGIMVTAVPGASAVLTALQLSGLPSAPFLFAGFLPKGAAERRAAISRFASVPATLVFLESPNRICAGLADLALVLGDRPAAVARELTKRHEEIRRGTLSALAAGYRGENAPKGEIVLVVGPPGGTAIPLGDEAIDDRLRAEIDGGSGVKDAASLVAAQTGRPRREVYARALILFRR